MFGFDRRQVVFRMRVDELVPAERVAWSCIGEQPEWVGTRLTWSIARAGNSTTLSLVHSDWRSVTPFLASCNSMWGHLMHRLRDQLEGKAPGPRWTE